MRNTPPFRYYASEISYFSAKVRPALRYKGIRFTELLPDVRGVILPRTGLAYIPILVTPEDETLQDTSDILDALEARFPAPPLYPRSPVQRVANLLFELYADEFLLLPAMHYRWSFPESEAKARADFAANTGDPVLANAFADRMSGALAVLGIDANTIPAIESHTEGLLDDLSDHFAAHAYLLGGRMSLADCALMGPLYAHLYLDAVPGRLLRERAPRVCHWIERMNRPDPDAPGAWLEDDGLAPTLRPLLERIGRDAVPLILDGAADFERWADARPDATVEPPRIIGMHATRLSGAACQRGTSAYTLWMLQRPLDAYRALDDAGRAAVDRVLDGTGCEALFAYAPRHRLGKRRFKLVFEAPPDRRGGGAGPAI
ncbi:MAG: glutathione S-transferase family protein [Deltaproteobacteria bacterium]|nr:MAG: glutathione S-transferase family protein [Deltaproteobacteria bacterium]